MFITVERERECVCLLDGGGLVECSRGAVGHRGGAAGGKNNRDVDKIFCLRSSNLEEGAGARPQLWLLWEVNEGAWTAL